MATSHPRIQITSEERRRELLADLAANFERPETAPWDWETLRHGKADAWPVER